MFKKGSHQIGSSFIFQFSNPLNYISKTNNSTKKKSLSPLSHKSEQNVISFYLLISAFLVFFKTKEICLSSLTDLNVFNSTKKSNIVSSFQINNNISKSK